MDFALLLPALINLGPWGIAIGVILYFRYEHAKELAARDVAADARETRHQAELADRFARIQASYDARLVDAKAMIESRATDNRESNKTTAESTAALGRMTPALETIGDTLREIAEEGRLERGIARDRETARRQQPGGTP